MNHVGINSCVSNVDSCSQKKTRFWMQGFSINFYLRVLIDTKFLTAELKVHPLCGQLGCECLAGDKPASSDPAVNLAVKSNGPLP